MPIGLIQLHTHPEPRKIIQTSGLILILYEANAGVRQIFTDGRPLPANDAQPWWYGYSSGKWDGDTLVVQTRGFRDDVWLDVEGSPLTESAKMTERFRRPNYGNMEIEVTVDDPKAYTKPWTVKVHHRIMLDTDLIEFVCPENEKDAVHTLASKRGTVIPKPIARESQLKPASLARLLRATRIHPGDGSRRRGRE